MKIAVDKEKCTGCSLCLNACPFGAIKVEEGFAVIDLDLCNYCGFCVEECPSEAITVERDVPVAGAKDISAYQDLLVFAEQRAGKLAHVSFELLCEGKKLVSVLGQKLCAVYIGPPGGNAEELLRRGADKVYAVLDDSLLNFQDDIFTDILARMHNGVLPRGLPVLIMGLMDAWIMDLNKLQQCSLTVVTPDGCSIPFCAYHLTDIKGKRLYPVGRRRLSTVGHPKI